jgi:hypothetical protein
MLFAGLEKACFSTEGENQMPVKKMTAPAGILVAHSAQVVFCSNPDCGRPHLMLFDENNMPFADAVMSDQMILDLVASRLAPPDISQLLKGVTDDKEKFDA